MTEKVDIVSKAREYAYKAHDGQTRKDGITPYFVHPMQVALILTIVTANEDVIAAGFLHDVVENCGVSYKTLQEEFNTTIADLVFEVTKEKRNGRKCFPRLHTREGILIKFADRLTNLADMKGWDDAKKQEYIQSSKFWKTK